ncbi:MAG: mono/diheme cytochrome c family protein [Oceanospirillaceae bacterium]|jgi:mono/diheme cytochrome c family protein
MSRTQSLLTIACLVLVAALSTYTYLAKQNNTNTWYNQAQVNQGEVLFLDNCAACHGAQAQGAENWMQPDAAGVRGAPPLNGSGHAWHHPLADLIQTITEGRGTMPAWKDTLTEEQMIATLAWTQSLWPTTTYKAWSGENP